MNETIFELKNVHYSYLGKFPALAGVGLTVKAGEKISVIGANGTGKSTLLTLLDGLIFPDSGTISAYGRELNEDLLNDEQFSNFFRKKVGFVFQNPDVALFCPTVREDIVFGPLQLGVPHKEVVKRLNTLAELFDIAAALHLPGHGARLDRSPRAGPDAEQAMDDALEPREPHDSSFT